MLNNLMKLIFLIVAICATFLLYGIYNKISTVKYQLVSSAESTPEIINVNTGQLYFFNYKTGFITFDEKHQRVYLKKLP